MAEDVGGYLTADLHSPTMPDTAWGDKPRPRRVGIRQLLPDSWIGSTLELSYVGADGGPASVRGVYLNAYLGRSQRETGVYISVAPLRCDPARTTRSSHE